MDSSVKHICQSKQFYPYQIVSFFLLLFIFKKQIFRQLEPYIFWLPILIPQVTLNNLSPTEMQIWLAKLIWQVG